MAKCRKCKTSIKPKHNRKERLGVCPACWRLERKIVKDFKEYHKHHA